MSIELVILSNHLILYCPLLLLPFIFPASGSFPMSHLFASGSQHIGVSALASILSMNVQGLFPFGLTVMISLQSMGLSRVFSSTTIWKHQFFQWIKRVDFLYWLIWSPFCPRDSQESSATPQCKNINSLVLSLLQRSMQRNRGNMQMTPPLWQKVKNSKASWWKWKWRVKKLA